MPQRNRLRRKLCKLPVQAMAYLAVGAVCFGLARTAPANPLGGVVVAGDVRIGSTGGVVAIDQLSDRAIINWRSFSIAPGEVTKFNQPDASSAILNRVTGGDPSRLLGAMQSNGRVFLLNPHGVLVGPDANIRVGSFTASTLDVRDSQFMAGGDLQFSGNSQAGVINRGEIRALGGDIFLIGAHVENHGLLQAPGGTANLAASSSVRLVDSAHPHLVVEAAGERAGGVGVLNVGTIDAARVELAASGNVFALAINNEGLVRASGAVEIEGEIILTGDGDVRHSGQMIARGSAGDGGRIEIVGENATVAKEAILDAGGTERGGEIRVVAANRADFEGTILAGGGESGGFAEVSGHRVLNYTGLADLRSPQGVSGTLLLDPNDVEINHTATVSGASLITPATIISNLATANVVIHTAGADAEAGDVFVNAPLIYDSPNSLGILAHRHVRFHASVRNGPSANSGAITVVAGWDGSTGFHSGGGPLEPAAVNFAAVLANANAFGGDNGSVFIGDGSQTSGVDVGVRLGGAVNVAAHRLTLRGGSANDAFAQLGFHPAAADSNTNSPINVGLKNGLTVQAGDGNNAFAQLGHGGLDRSGDHRGAITIHGAGDLHFQGGDGRGAYAQLGNGGRNADGDHAGALTIRDAGDLLFQAGDGAGASAQLGHGGLAAGGDHSGAITLRNVGDLEFQTGEGADASAQLGHGGLNADGDHVGAIVISGAGDLDFHAGGGAGAYVQLGHGGFAADGDHAGAINVSGAGGLDFHAGGGANAYAQLGHGDAAIGFSLHSSGEKTGNIDVRLTGGATLTGGANPGRTAMIGHATRAGAVTGDVLLAIDQENSRADGGGRLVMANEFTRIDMDGASNQVRIFDSRRDGASPQMIANGAILNGAAFDDALPPGAITMAAWSRNDEFSNTPQEQWGEWTPAAPGPYAAPFTFFFFAPRSTASEDSNGFEIPNLSHDAFDRARLWAAHLRRLLVESGEDAGALSYGDNPRDRNDELTGADSGELFGDP